MQAGKKGKLFAHITMCRIFSLHASFVREADEVHSFDAGVAENDNFTPKTEIHPFRS